MCVGDPSHMSTTPVTPQTPELIEPEGAETPAEERRPDLKAPPSSPPADSDALAKGLEVMDRVKPY
jgi:hypothetical protein